MAGPIRILLQTTIHATPDDWHIGRFSLLRDFLASQTDDQGNALFNVTARDGEGTETDPILSTLADSDFDELWLFAVAATCSDEPSPSRAFTTSRTITGIPAKGA